MHYFLEALSTLGPILLFVGGVPWFYFSIAWLVLYEDDTMDYSVWLTIWPHLTVFTVFLLLFLTLRGHMI